VGLSGDTSGFKPDTYIVASVVRKARKGPDICIGGSKTGVVSGTVNPVFDKELMLSTAGDNDRVVLNIMSSHFLQGAGFLGQVRFFYLPLSHSYSLTR